jgi:hypothetical protein
MLWEYPSGTVSGLEAVMTGQLEVSHLLVILGVVHWLNWVQVPKETHQPQAKPGLNGRQEEQVVLVVQSKTVIVPTGDTMALPPK